MGGSPFSFLGGEEEGWLLRPRAGQSQHWVSCTPSPSSPALGGLGGAIESAEEKFRIRAGMQTGNRSEAVMEPGPGPKWRARDRFELKNGTGVRDGDRVQIE